MLAQGQVEAVQMLSPVPVVTARGLTILPADRFYDARIFDPADPAR
jgi:hypothetical protein